MLKPALQVDDFVIFGRDQRAWLGKIVSLEDRMEAQFFRSQTKGPTAGRIFNPCWINNATGQEHWEPARGNNKIEKTTFINSEEIIVGGFQLRSRKIPTEVLNVLAEKFKTEILVAMALPEADMSESSAEADLQNLRQKALESVN